MVNLNRLRHVRTACSFIEVRRFPCRMRHGQDVLPRPRPWARLLRDILMATSVTEFPGGFRSTRATFDMVRYVVMKQMIVFCVQKRPCTVDGEDGQTNERCEVSGLTWHCLQCVSTSCCGE